MVCLIAGSARHVQAEAPVTVFAAASLKDVLEAAAVQWGGELRFSYGGSGLIARQVAQGAPADLVILANRDWMSWLADQGALGSPAQTLVSNRLVVIAPAADAAPLEPASWAGILGDARIAVGNTRGVPAGIYARDWLEQAGLWDALSNRLAETDNVRAALALVARAEAPFGIVYHSDAQADASVSIVYTVPEQAHAPILYQFAVLETPRQAQAADFTAFLLSAEGQALFAEYGFSPVKAPL